MVLHLGHMYVPFYLILSPGYHILILAQHVVSSREHNTDPVTFTSAAFNQLRLNQLDPDTFPIPKFSLTPRKNIESKSRMTSDKTLLISVISSYP